MARSKKKGRRNLFIGIGLLLLIGIGLAVFGFQQTAFDFERGYEPYGESPNQITNLEKDVLFSYTPDPEDSSMTDDEPLPQKTSNGFAQDTIQYSLSTSKYWDITRVYKNRQVTGSGGFDGTTSDFEGSDFQIQGEMSRASISRAPVIYETTESFGDRDFAVDLYAIEDFSPSTRTVSTEHADARVFLVSNNQEIEVLDRRVSEDRSTLEISPSPVTDDVDIIWNGVRVDTVSISGDYTIKLVMTGDKEGAGPGNEPATSPHVVEKPRYKQQFGCTTEPDEQTYVKIINEGGSVDLEDLDNFEKFCLDELPLQVISNTGATTDTSALVQLTEGNQFTVPTGQIWAVQYIGEKRTFDTECEAGVVEADSGECLARASIEYSCPDGGFNPETLRCEVETEPTEFNDTAISTHQRLENNGQFIFVHNFDDVNDRTSEIESFDLFGSQFTSQGASSEGILEFSYEGQSYTTNSGSSRSLDEFLSVTSNIEVYRENNDGSIDDYTVEYIFDFDRDMFNINYTDGEIIVTNNYKTMEGGVTITTVDEVGTTEVRNVDQTLQAGENSFSVDTEGVLEVRARPYVTLQPNNYQYKFDGTNGMIVSLEEETEEVVNVEIVQDFNVSQMIIIGIIASILLVVLIIGIVIFRRRR